MRIARQARHGETVEGDLREVHDRARIGVVTDEELLIAATAEMRELDQAGVLAAFCIPAVNAFQLIGILQLALRHPGVSVQMQANVSAVIRGIALQIAPDPASALAEMIRRGSDPAYDVDGIRRVYPTRHTRPS